MDGAVIVNKEKGYTSFDVVAKARRIFETKKIGHTGTLDPQAEGVLVLCLGKATGASELLAEHDKDYDCLMLLGKTTDTEDVWGNIISESEVLATDEDIRAACAKFTGEINQIPPAYSALKVCGRRSYELSREGKPVELAPRKVFIDRLSVTEVDVPYVRFKATCSKGTYVRSLCRDIGKMLGCGACMAGLIRTRSGSFNISESYTIPELERMKREETLDAAVIPTERLFDKYPAAMVKKEFENFLLNGNKLKARMLDFAEHDKMLHASGDETPILRIYTPDGNFRALYVYDEFAKIYRVRKMF